MRHFSAKAALLFGLCVLAGSAWAESRVALVVGNSAYEHAPRLPNPSNDAARMAEILRRLDFDVIHASDLDGGGMRRTLRTFGGRLEGTEVALFYYAGHGLQVEGKNFIVPVDARLSNELDLEFEATELNKVLRIMERAASTNLVFLDACRDNPLARNLLRSMGATRSGAVGRGLARVESGIGTLIAFATQPGNVALDGTGDNSPFTTALLQHIGTPGLDVAQMLRRVRQTVIASTNRQQVPWSHSSLTGDFYFKRAQPEATAPETLGGPESTTPGFNERAMELSFWETIKESDDWRDFQAYLDQFGEQGTFGGLAKVRRDRLKEVVPHQEAAAKPGAEAKAQRPAEEKPQREHQAALTGDYDTPVAGSTSIAGEKKPVQTARLTPPDETPIRSKAEVQAYLDKERRKILRKINRFNDEKRFFSFDDDRNIKITSFESIEIEDVYRDFVVLQIAFWARSAGPGWTGATDQASGTFILRWIDDDLEFQRIFEGQW